MLEFEMQIDEAEVNTPDVAPEKNTILLVNRSGTVVDEEVLAERLVQTRGIERIKRVVVQPSSQVRRVTWIRGVPMLESLQIFGLNLVSAEGVEGWTRGKYLEIDTGRNKARDLKQLAEARVEKMRVRCATKGDLSAIAGNPTASMIELVDFPEIQMDGFRASRMHDLSVYGGRIKTFGDTVRAPTLRTLLISNCRKLEAITGDNSGVSWLVIEKCNELDPSTIATFRNVESLHLSSLKKEVDLEAFEVLTRLRKLSVQGCRVRGEGAALKDTAPSLEDIKLYDANRPVLESLSAANPGVVVSGREGTYVNGHPAPAMS